MISLAEYKKMLEKYLYSEDVLEYVFNTFYGEYEERLNNIEKELERQKNLYELELTKKQQNKEELELIKSLTTKEGLTEAIIDGLKEIKEFKEYTYKILNKPIYKEYVNYIVYGEELNKETINNMQDYFLLYNGIIARYTQKLCFYDNSKINNKRLKGLFNAFIHTGMITFVLKDKNAETIFKNGLKEKANNIKYEEIKEFIKYFEETEKRADIISNEGERRILSKEETKREQLTLPLEYSQNATLTDTGLINKLALTKLEDNYLLEEIKNLDFSIEEKTIKNSEKTIDKLDELDRFILDTIVIDFYYKQGLTKFTNRQIAIQYCKEKGIEHITENILNNIDASIIKLQNTRINLDYKSVQKLKKANVKVGRNNPLIWLEEITLDIYGTKTKGYEIIRTPFYFTYAKETNALMITYDRKLLYADIKGIEKNIDNQNLRHYLIRRLAPSKSLNTNEIYIKINDIYEAQNIHKKDFKTPNALKTARKKARERTELLLKEYKKEYNFNFSKDDEKKRIKGYIIRFKNKSNN